MIAKVVGIRKGIDFKTDDGKQISGNKLHLVYQDDNVQGHAVTSLFVNSNIDISHVVVNNSYDFVYENGFGKRPRLIRIDEVTEI